MAPTVGAHVGQQQPLDDAAAIGAEAVQIFLGDPQSWRKPDPRDDADALRAAPIPVFVHAPYLINVCSPRNNVRYGSRKILQQTLEAAAQIDATAVIVHGGHAEDGVEAGVSRWARTLTQLKPTGVPIYLENTAGGSNAVARRFDALALLWEAIGDARDDLEVGFCFDTCHAHAAGEPLDGAVDRARAITGRIDLLHANDSRDPAGTGADRHANLGRGEIPVDELRAMIAAAGCPIVVETPGGLDDVRADLAFVRDALAAANA